MSISGSLSNALSGLTAAARMADVVSSNTANALTEGYARRELSLVAQSVGGNGAGVKVVGVNRSVNEPVLQDRRIATAAASNATARTDFYAQIEEMIGTPEDASSLSSRLATLDSSLITAASMPESESRLSAVLSSAQNVSDQLNDMSDGLMQIRMNADKSISAQVDTLNQSLTQIDELNAKILAVRSSGSDATALLDQRQALVDKVSEIVPVRQLQRDNDQIVLYTTGGAILLEGNPAEIGFTSTPVITAGMTLENGALSGLTINGMAVSPSDDGVLGGGTLGAMFAVRDELAPGVQSQIDAVARDLVERFSDSAVDPTLTATTPGLFTDGGAVFDASLEVGLAGRIEINAAADPEQGGALWRLRDGMGATTPGDVGNSTLLVALSDALNTERVPASGGFGLSMRSASGLVSDLLSSVSSDRQASETVQSYTTARQETLNEMALADGVDTDYELQTLLKVEQAYAANARVIKTLDELMQQLLSW